LLDLGLSVQRQLRDLPYPAYLLAMSVIGQELQDIYADLLSDDGDMLARQTVDAIKAAYLSGQAAVDGVWQLHRRWEELIEDPRLMARWACSAPCMSLTCWLAN